MANKKAVAMRVQAHEQGVGVLYSQPLYTTFETQLKRFLVSPKWSSLDIAVAWVRASGTSRLHKHLLRFARAGKRLRIVVGIDFDNTTTEGLESLLKLSVFGNVQLFVYHNEAGTIFHPKLYLFADSQSAKLIVGSNNLTQGGLCENIEVGMCVDLSIDHAIIRNARASFDVWSDTTKRLARRLDRSFLTELVENGYVCSEAAVKKTTADMIAARRKRRRKTLFGRDYAAVPRFGELASRNRRNKRGRLTQPSLPSESILLMRVRLSRGSQGQVPTELATSYFANKPVISSAGATRRVREAGGGNTWKLELPETRGLTDPVVRFAKTRSAIRYEVFDGITAKGKAILAKLRAGLRTNPKSTVLTKPARPTSSTWWRMV
jgi:HKD family nuclease